MRHSNAVLRSFYGFWIERGEGPLTNPVPQDRARGRRPNAHHNPLEPFRPEGKLRYNPPVPKRQPRAILDQRWDELFAGLRSNRDRAILALVISTAIRAAELLGIRLADVDWGDQLVRVRRKGTDAEQWLPASADAFVWLRLYLDEVGELAPSDPIWWTLRRRRRSGTDLARQPLNYDALRAVLRRVNDLLGRTTRCTISATPAPCGCCATRTSRCATSRRSSATPISRPLRPTSNRTPRT